jgi:hypothetical protein
VLDTLADHFADPESPREPRRIDLPRSYPDFEEVLSSGVLDSVPRPSNAAAWPRPPPGHFVRGPRLRRAPARFPAPPPSTGGAGTICRTGVTVISGQR